MIKAVIVILSAWLSMTILVDFVAVPTVFKTVSNLEQAGSLGIKIFSFFNKLELILGIILVVISISLLRAKRITKKLCSLSIILLLLSSFYVFKVLPTLSKLHENRKELVQETQAYIENEKNHDFYHKLYVKLDGGKIIIILMMLVLALRVPLTKSSLQIKEER